MRTVRQLLGDKTPDVYAVASDASVFEAIQLMAEKGVGAVLVIDGTRLSGIISERDYARKIVLQGRSSANTPVRDVMTSQLVTVRPDDNVDNCMQLVTRNRIRHLPVIEGDDVVGVISIGDLVKAVIEDQQIQLDLLQRYIAS